MTCANDINNFRYELPPVIGDEQINVNDMRAYARQAIAPYAEQIKKLERELAELRVERKPIIGQGGPAELAQALNEWCAPEFAAMQRELAERKQVQSIGEDPEFKRLTLEWADAVIAANNRCGGKVVLMNAYDALIAYIDARPAGTAPASVLKGWHKADRAWSDYPEGTKARESWVSNGFWTKTERGWKWHLGATFPTPGGADEVLIAAAPSLSTGTEESK